MAEIKRLSTELQVKDKLLDTSGDAGTSGQILSSTGTGTNWINSTAFTGGTVANATTFSALGTFNNDILANGHIYGRSVDGQSSRLYRFGGVYLTWDSDSYGTNDHHSLRSTYGNSFTDSITLNSYNHIRFNIDSNNNNSTSYFEVGDGVTDTSNVIFRLDQAGDVTITGDITVSGGDIILGGDVNLYRDGANILRTDDAFHANGHIHVGGASGGGNIYNRSDTGNYIGFSSNAITFSKNATFSGDITVSKTDPTITLVDSSGANTDPNGTIIFSELSGTQNFDINYNGASDRLEFRGRVGNTDNTDLVLINRDLTTTLQVLGGATFAGNTLFAANLNVGYTLNNTQNAQVAFKKNENISVDTNSKNVFIDYNLSGTTAQTGDRYYDALTIDLDSSATGGDTTNETRISGIRCFVTDTGDSNDIYGGNFDVRATKSVANDKIAVVYGVYAAARAAHTAGDIGNAYGGYFQALSDDASSGTNMTSLTGVRGLVTNTADSGKIVNNAYGGFFKVDQVASSNNSVFTNVDGVYGEVEIDDGDVTINAARAVRGLIDSNAGTISSAYQFYGSTTAAGTITNNWGVYSTGAAKNYLSGTLQLPSYGAGTLVTDAGGNITVSSGGGAGGPYLPLAGGTMTGNLQAPKFIAAQGTTYANGYQLTRTGHDTYRICLGNSEGLRIVNETDSNREELGFDGAGNASFAGNVESQDTFILNYNNAGNKWQQLFDGSNNWNLRYYNGTSWSSNYLNISTTGNATFAGDVTVAGNLNITGDINSVSVTDLDVTDKTITIAKGAADSAAADGAGIIVDGASASILYDHSGTQWEVNKPFEVKVGSSAITMTEYSNSAYIWLDGSNGDFTGGDYYNIAAIGGGSGSKLSFGYAAAEKMYMDMAGNFLTTGVIDVNGTGTSTFAGPISISPPSSTGWQGLTITGSGTSHTQGAIVLKSSTTDTPEARGQGVFMFNEGDDVTWYMGTRYQDADEWQLGRKAGASIDTEAAETGNAFLKMHNSGRATFTGSVFVQSDDADKFLVRSNDYTIARIISRGTSGVNLDKGLFSLMSSDGTNNNIEKVRIDTAGNSWFNGGSTSFGGNVTIYPNSSSGSLTVGRYAGQDIKLEATDLTNTILSTQDADENQEHNFILNRVHAGTGADNFKIQKGGTDQLTIDKNANATFAGDTTFSAGVVKKGSGGYYLHNSSGTFRAAFWDNGSETRLFADGNGSTATLVINDNNTTFAGNIVLDDGSGASPTITFRNGADEEWYLSENSSGKLIIQQSTTERGEWSSSGLVIKNGALSITGDGSNAVTFTESGNGLMTIAAPDDIVLDAESDITLDANGADIRLKRGGTHYATLRHNNTGLDIQANESNASIYLTPNGTGNVYASTDTFIVSAYEGETAKILLRTDESDDNGDDWYITNETNNNLEFTNDKTGSQLANLTLTPQGPSNSAVATFAGNVVAGNRIQTAVGSAGAPTHTFTGKTDTGMYARDHSSNDRLAFSVDGTERAYIDSNGVTSMGNYYLPSGNSFRNYSGVWAATTGISGNGFTFANTADNSGAVLLSITSDSSAASASVATFAGAVNMASNKITSDGSAAAGAYLELKHANNNTTDVCATINLTNNAGGYAAIVGGTTGANNTGYIEFKTDNAGTQSTALTLNGDNTATFTGNITGVTETLTGTESLMLTLNPTANNYGGIWFKYGGTSKGMSVYNSGSMVYGGESGVGTILQTNGQHALNIDTSQNATFAGKIKSTETPADLASAPTVAFGDGNTGFYERSDNDLRVTIGGTGTYEFSANCMGGVNEGRAHFNAEVATATNPTVIPWRNDSDTGIGRASANNLSLIAGGTEALRLSTTDATFAGSIVMGGATLANGYMIEMIPSGGNILRSTRGTSVFGSYQSTDGPAYFGTTSSDDFVLITNDVARLTLSAAGNATFAGKVRAARGTKGEPTYTFTQDQNTGMYQDGNDHIKFTAGGNDMLNVNVNAGKVGVTGSLTVSSDIEDRDIPCLFNSNWLDGTSSSILLVPFNKQDSEATVSARTYYHNLTMPAAGKVAKVVMKNVSGSASSGMTTQLFLYVNGSQVASSSELTISSDAITWSPTSSNTFSAGDELSFGYQKNSSGKTWSGASMGIIVELTDYDI